MPPLPFSEAACESQSFLAVAELIQNQCLLDPENPEGDCVPCKTFSKTSKKTIHRSPCYRKKITDVVLYRKGGLGLTKRWEGTEMKNVGDRVNSADIHTIAFTIGAYCEPIQVKVVRFEPRPGDATRRMWTTNVDGALQWRYKELEPYCLVDIQEAASDFEKYITNNALDAFINRPNYEDPGDAYPDDEAIFERTYMLAVAHYMSLPVGDPTSILVCYSDTAKDEVKAGEKSMATANPEKRLLGHLFTLWFATREHRRLSIQSGSNYGRPHSR